jgi:hypothetical protein
LDWLTSLFETLNALAMDQGAWTYLSLIPLVLGTALQGGEEAVEQDDEDLGFDPDDDNDDQQTQGQEPFLRAGESVYKTQEEAARGIAEKDRYIGEYKQYGTPAEIAVLRERAKMAERFEQAMQTGTPEQKQRAWDSLDPDTKAKFDNFDKHYGAELKNRFASKEDLEQAGYVKRDGLRGEFEAFQKEEQAKNFASEGIKSRGLQPMSPGLALKVVNSIVGELAGENPDLHQKIVRKYQGGDIQGAVSDALDVLYGPAKKGKPAGGEGGSTNGRARDANGRYVDPAAVDRAKRQAGRLPDAPPSGNGRATEGQDSQPVDRKARRAAALEQLQAASRARS